MKRNKNDIDIYKHLTQDELVDYTAGILGNDEMYRLELHLNECELCSHAIEGVELIKTPKIVLDQIASEVLPHTKNYSKPNYLAIAASIALVAVIGLSYWLITKPINEATIAINEPQEVVEEPHTLVPEKSSKEKEEVTEVSTEEIPEELGRSIAESTSPPITSQQQVVGASTDNQKQKVSIEPNEVEKPEPITDIASIVLEADENEEVLAAEEKGSDQDLEGAVALSEVVQSVPKRTSKARKKEASINLNTLKDQKEPTPIGGMVSLKTYIDNNLSYPQEAIDNNIKGVVVLEVSINSDGSLNNISIIKGLGYGCDAEAMKLITTGPKWTPKVENGIPIKASQQIKIKFKK